MGREVWGAGGAERERAESGLRMVELVEWAEEQRPGGQTSAAATGARKCWRLLCGRRQEILVTNGDCRARGTRGK